MKELIINKQNILQAIKKVKEEKKRVTNKPRHHCEFCFIYYLRKIIATFNKNEHRSCMVVLREINKVFGTTYYIYKVFCGYDKAIPYEPIFKKLNKRIISI